MSHAGANLLQSALALPEDERAAIAEALWSSLPDEEGADLDNEAFAKELQRRSEEAKNDPTSVIPWSELKKLR